MKININNNEIELKQSVTGLQQIARIGAVALWIGAIDPQQMQPHQQLTSFTVPPLSAKTLEIR